MLVAMHDGTNLKYFAQDHLSSTAIVMNASGGLISQNRYMPFGQVRDNIPTSPITQTDFGYTGQRNISSMGLMDYRARFYSPVLGRFTQPDSIVPDMGNPQAWNRYSYTINNPLRYNDPSGNCPWCIGAVIGGLVGAAIGAITYAVTNSPENRTTAGWTTAVVGGAVGGALIGSGVGLVVGAAQTVTAAAAAGTAYEITAASAAVATAASPTVTTLVGAGTGALTSGTSYMLTNQNSFDPLDYAATTTFGTISGAASGYTNSAISNPLWRFGANAFNGAVTSNLQYIWDSASIGDPISNTNIAVNSFYGGFVEGLLGTVPQIDGPSTLLWRYSPKVAAAKAGQTVLTEVASTAALTTGTSVFVTPTLDNLTNSLKKVPY